jgi:hypothetical protein
LAADKQNTLMTVIGSNSTALKEGGGGILMKATPRVLAVDIGRTNVKILATRQAEPRKFGGRNDPLGGRRGH